MFIDLGMRVELSDEQFIEEMAMRRQKLALGPNDHVIGCPLCLVIPENGNPDYFENLADEVEAEAESSDNGSASDSEEDAGRRGSSQP